MVFPFHNPAAQTFNWICELSGASGDDIVTAAQRIRIHVRTARTLYTQPFGTRLPYDDQFFRAAYLIAYFPYYIEPLCHALDAADIPASFFERSRLKVSFFGGGPCPEVLGLAAYLRGRAPHLEKADINVYDREPNWMIVQKDLVPDMLPSYASAATDYSITSRQCNVVECLNRECSCGVAGTDIIIAQNFLTEVHGDRDRALQTFERLVRRSGCRYLVFVENRYDQVRDMMNDIAGHLYAEGLAVRHERASSDMIRPNFVLPDILNRHIFTGESGLIARKYVKFHHMVIEIAR